MKLKIRESWKEFIQEVPDKIITFYNSDGTTHTENIIEENDNYIKTDKKFYRKVLLSISKEEYEKGNSKNTRY